jgi:hypothetical protein
MANNEHEVTGTLYSKITRTAVGKKTTNAGKVYEFYYYVIEVPTIKVWSVEGKEKRVEKKELIKFKLPMGMSPDDFERGDHIFVRFTITGREWEKKDGSGKDVINENEIKLIKFADIESGQTDSRHNPNREKVFVAPTVNENVPDNNQEDDLPF